MKILITGASSYVGARLFFDLRKKFEVIGTYNTSRLSTDFVHMDVTIRDEVLSVIRRIKPGVIIHAVANPNARWCEANPELAKKLNEGGTRNVVDAANEIGAKVIYISTKAAINPQNVYGKTKLAGEEISKETKAGFVILRPSLIVGFSPNTTNDRPFNRMLKSIDDKVPAIYDTSWKFQPTWLGHISEIIEKIVKKGITNETIPITVPEFKTRFDLARDILSRFGISVEPKDYNDKTPVTETDQSKMVELNLPVHSYSEIIENMVDEIKNREKFRL